MSNKKHIIKKCNNCKTENKVYYSNDLPSEPHKELYTTFCTNCRKIIKEVKEKENINFI